MWARDPWGRAPWAAPAVITPPGQQLPPAIPGGTGIFTYRVQAGAAPWARWGWAGGGITATYAGGAIVLIPQPESGVMEVMAWWPDATYLRLTRIAADGTRTPVRGGYPLTVGTVTRRNYATNPSVEAGLNGYVPGTGSPTLSQIARTDGNATAGSYAGRATNASAGTSEITIPHAIPNAGPLSIGLDLKFDQAPTAVTITVGWNDSSGGAFTASVITVVANQIATTVNQFGWVTGTVTPPTAAATVSSIKLAATGMPAGGTMDWDRVLCERSVDLGDYFDGDVVGGTWAGAADLSASSLADVVSILDGECPLDAPVSYELYNPSLIGGRMTSPTATLDSLDRTWLTHPASPDAPIVCQPTKVPDLTRSVDQGVFRVLDRQFPVVVTSSIRYAEAGELELAALSWDQRDTLLDLVAAGQPLLIRTPGDYGWPGRDGAWIALSDITESAGGRKAQQDCRVFTAPFQRVDAPAGENFLAA